MVDRSKVSQLFTKYKRVNGMLHTKRQFTVFFRDSNKERVISWQNPGSSYGSLVKAESSVVCVFWKVNLRTVNFYEAVIYFVKVDQVELKSTDLEGFEIEYF
jgi:hypothetical protein